jgi:hypothetical protein
MMSSGFDMDKPSHCLYLFMITVLLCAPVAFAQNDEPATALPSEPPVEETAPQGTSAPPGQEVGINEDNYRQFMELKDPLQQRDILPEDAYKPQSGLQKLENLPEESQKHLRNQLREIIVQGDQWQPGDEEIDYPYVPSEAAGTNPSLQKQEAEAWDELVDSYHVREAEIYENSARSEMAAANTSASGGQAGNGEGSASDSAGQGDTGEQMSQEGGSEQSKGKDSYSPNSPNDPNAVSTEGVSQNALEFLQKSRTPGAMEDTLKIEDLRNAQGVGQPVVSGVSTGDVVDEEDSEDDNTTPDH